MSIHCRVSIEALASSDVAERNVYGSMAVLDRIWSSFGEAASGGMKLAAGAIDQAVCFSTVLEGKLLLLRCDGECQVKFNSTANPAIVLAPVTDGNGVPIPGFLTMLGKGVTSLHVSNPGTSSVLFDFCVIGD